MALKQSVIGIDIGSLDSIVGYVKRGGVDVVQNEVSERKTQSLVGFTDKERLLGGEAQATIKSNFKNTCRNFKQVIGRKADDPELEREKMYALAPLVEDEDGQVGYEVSYHNEKQVIPCTRALGMYLSKMVDISQKWTENNVCGAVISVPSYFSDVHRQAVRDACEMIDLNCLRVMNENTATALAYGIYRTKDFSVEDPMNVAFISTGHSSASCTVAQFYSDRLQVIGECTDRSVSGREMDRALIEYFAEKLQEEDAMRYLEQH